MKTRAASQGRETREETWAASTGRGSRDETRAGSQGRESREGAGSAAQGKGVGSLRREGKGTVVRSGRRRTVSRSANESPGGPKSRARRARVYPGDMLIGDVLAAVAILLGTALTSWTTLLAFRLLFPRRVAIAAEEMRRGAFPLALVGAGTLLVPGGIALTMLSAGPGPVKMIGFVGLAWILAIAAVGGAGIAATLEDRMDGIAGFARTSRAAAILVGAANLPVLGWFVFAPILLAVSTGAGVRALLRPERPPIVVGDAA